MLQKVYYYLSKFKENLKRSYFTIYSDYTSFSPILCQFRQFAYFPTFVVNQGNFLPSSLSYREPIFLDCQAEGSQKRGRAMITNIEMQNSGPYLFLVFVCNFPFRRSGPISILRHFYRPIMRAHKRKSTTVTFR